MALLTGTTTFIEPQNLKLSRTCESMAQPEVLTPCVCAVSVHLCVCVYLCVCIQMGWVENLKRWGLQGTVDLSCERVGPIGAGQLAGKYIYIYCMYVCMYVCVCVYILYVCMYVCMYICMYMYVNKYICIYVALRQTYMY
jgi:hypothetical protein